MQRREVPGGPYRTEQIGYLEEHLDHMRRWGFANSTIRARCMVLTWLAEALGHDPATATYPELERWQSTIRTAPALRWQTLIIRPYYRYLQAIGVRQDNPAALLPLPRRRRGVPKPISDERLFRAVAAAPMPILGYLLLAGWSGLRAVEIARLDVEHFQRRADGEMTALVHGKGGDHRLVPIPEWVWATIKPRLPESGPCFTRTYGDKTQRVTRKQISDNVRYYLGTTCGFADRLHSLRHRVATAVLRDTKDVRLVQELLGHANLATLHVYTEVLTADMAAAVERLPRPPSTGSAA